MATWYTFSQTFCIKTISPFYPENSFEWLVGVSIKKRRENRIGGAFTVILKPNRENVFNTCLIVFAPFISDTHYIQREIL